MIESIHIENFKCLEKLTIHSLSRVNLIIGKNNTGKSTLLEAIALYASQADLKEIARILKDRGVIFTQTSASKSITEYNIENFSSLFTNRHVGFQPPDRILIGTHVNTLFGKEITLESSVSLRFVKYNTEIDEVTNKTNKNIEQLDNEIFIRNYGFGIEIRNGLMPRILPLDDERLYSRPIFRNTDTVTNFQFVRTYDQAKEVNGNLWDKITLTEKEAYVIQALRIIEPRIERIAFVNDGDRFRSAVFKMINSNTVLPLQSMGDGINRILSIILALIHSEKGFLLIDEFENGLHHSVQEKLWEIIFELSNILDIQVFATTHSEDCIAGFESVLNMPEKGFDGRLIRLDLVDDKIQYVAYSKQEIGIAMENDIETR